MAWMVAAGAMQHQERGAVAVFGDIEIDAGNADHVGHHRAIRFDAWRGAMRVGKPWRLQMKRASRGRRSGTRTAGSAPPNFFGFIRLTSLTSFSLYFAITVANLGPSIQ